MLSLERRGQLPEELQLRLKKHAIPHFLEEHSDSIALCTPEKNLSYTELHQQSDSLAHHLIENGIQPHDRVAILAEPSLECAVAMVGIMKAGGVVVPIDPISQKCHISTILEQAKPKLLLSETATVPSYLSDELNTLKIKDLLDERGISIDRNPEPQDPAYLVFTLHDDKLQGIELPHHSITNLACWTKTAYQSGSEEIVAIAARLRCESFIPELLSTLCTGATVKFLPGQHLQSAPDLKQWIYDEAVQWITLRVSAAEELLEEQWSKNCPLNILFVGGGRLKKPPVSDLPFKVINLYGHPECGAVSMEYEVSPEEESLIIPIGHPISNVKPYVLNESFQEVAHGESGQLCLGGMGLATGYLNEELNHTHFVIQTRGGKRPERLFLTGDLVRKRNDGKLEYLGKVTQQEAIGDDQVGLSAVENIISSHTGILHAYVKPITVDDETILAAYWVGKKNASIAEANLKRALKRRLPPHMVPRYLIELAQFPIGVDGQVCAEQLPIPRDDENKEEEKAPPTNAMEKKLMELWESTLEVHVSGIHTSFFDLEIPPHLISKLHQNVTQHFGKEIPLSAFFQRDTVAKQAQWLMAKETPSDEAILTIEGEGSGPPLICLHGFVESAYLYFLLSKSLKEKVPLIAINVTNQEKSIEELATETIEKIKHVCPKGPYRLLGGDIGGYLVYELAKQLGSQVTFAGVLDTWAPNSDQKPPFFKRLQINAHHFFHLTGDQKKQYMIKRLERFENRISELFGFKKSSENQGELVPDSIWWAERKAMKAYIPDPTEMELTIFRCQNEDEETFFHENDPSLGWKALSNHLKIEKTSGSHGTLYQKDHMKSFAAKLLKTLG